MKTSPFTNGSVLNDGPNGFDDDEDSDSYVWDNIDHAKDDDNGDGVVNEWDDVNGNGICYPGECEEFEDEGEEASTVFGMPNEEVFFRN